VSRGCIPCFISYLALLEYQKRAYAALLSIEKYCKREGGYAGIGDVRLAKQVSYINQTETFLFAELLKYLYLTFDDPNIFNLDEWVVSMTHAFTPVHA
jgi:mannosyl-oligosaccharide alpha-1,2-mannosidase